MSFFTTLFPKLAAPTSPTIPANWNISTMSPYAGVPGDPNRPFNMAGYIAFQKQTVANDPYKEVNVFQKILLRNKLYRETFPWEWSWQREQMYQSQGSTWTNVWRPILPALGGMATGVAWNLYSTPAAIAAEGESTAAGVFTAGELSQNEIIAAEFGMENIPAISTGAGAVVQSDAELIAEQFGMINIPAASPESVAAADATLAGEKFSYLSTGKDVLGVVAAGKSILSGAAKTISEKGAQYMNEVFGGSGGGSVPGAVSVGSGGADSGGFSSMSKLPFILIILTLFGAFLLTRKRKGKI